MYCYIQKCGKVPSSVLCSRYNVSSAYLSELSALGTNIDCELESHYSEELDDSLYEIKQKGLEYLSIIRRDILIASVSSVLALASVLLTIFL